MSVCPINGNFVRIDCNFWTADFLLLLFLHRDSQNFDILCTSFHSVALSKGIFGIQVIVITHP